MRNLALLWRMSRTWQTFPVTATSAAAAMGSFYPVAPFLWTLSRSFSVKLRSSEAEKLVQKPGPLQEYESMVAQNILFFDPVQHEVAKTLEDLLGNLKEHQKKMEEYHRTFSRWQAERDLRRRQLLKDEAEAAARQRLDSMADYGKGVVTRWLRRRTRKSMAESGAGRLVAHLNREKLLDKLVGPQPEPPCSPKGVYLYGSVGCGKTMLMDLLFRSADGLVQQRRRLHFHAAMLEVHELMHRIGKQKKQTLDTAGRATLESSSMSLEGAVEKWLGEEEVFQQEYNSDHRILDAVADKLLGSDTSEGASLLCFDEVQVVDVFTAVALSGILGRLLQRGAVLVATSNRAPSDLNKEGLQKEIFDCFIADLQRYCHPVLVGLEKDYRRLIASNPHELNKQRHYLWPLDQRSESELNNQWKEITAPLVQRSGCAVGPNVIPVMFGRELLIPHSCCGVARFTFDQLCDQPVGAADYIALARHCHTVFVTDVPTMSMRIRDKARRFITLVDELYNHRCRLICSAAAPVDELFTGNDEEPLIDLESLQFETEAEGSRLRRNVQKSGGVSPVALSVQDRASIRFILSGREELFAFHRAVSRLIEMQTAAYLRVLPSHPAFQIWQE